MAKEFVISDDAVLNDRGFRVITSGIRLERFIKNPLLLFMHARPSRWELKKDSVLAIGTVENLRIEGTRLIGTPVFDEDDEFAKKIMDKVEKGIYRMVSPGLEPITMSSDEKYLLPGQRYESVVECDLIEISIADIGSNPNSLALYKSEKEDYVILSSEQITSVVQAIKSNESNPEINNMKKIALALGMSENATEDELVAKINENKNANTALATEVETIRLNAITKAVDTAIADKRFTADQKEEMIALGKTVGVDKLQSVIELMKPATKPTDHLNGGSNGKGGDDTITLASLMKEGVKVLELFKTDHPEKYAELYKDHYGVEYVKPVED